MIGYIQNNFHSPLMIPLWFSIICGTLIGLERELKNKDAGIKTTVFICVGACLYTFLSQEIEGTNDNSRVISQIVSGVGFLGGGVIFKTKDGVEGLTSAAIIWTCAAIGILCGLQKYFEAGMATLTIISLVFLFNYLKKMFRKNDLKM